MRATVLPLAGTEPGRAQLTIGAGGDRTMELDRAAEADVFAELEALAGRGERFAVLSEEAGHRKFGADYPLVLVDPVDGSLNAKQGVPFFGVMLALVDGPTIGDTVVGCVVNLINGEAWTAIRKQGAKRGGEPLRPMTRQSRDRLELIALESLPGALVGARGHRGRQLRRFLRAGPGPRVRHGGKPAHRGRERRRRHRHQGQRAGLAALHPRDPDLARLCAEP